MATCKDCGARNNVTLERTGKTKLIAKPLASHSLAGGQMKTSAISYPELKLSFLCCGTYVLGYADSDDNFVVPDQTIHRE